MNRLDFKDLNEATPTITPFLYKQQVILQVINNLINTSKGERLFNPTSGAGLENYIGELATPDTANLMFHVISDELEKEFDGVVKLSYSESDIVADLENNVYIINIVCEIVSTGEKVVYTSKI